MDEFELLKTNLLVLEQLDEDDQHNFHKTSSALLNFGPKQRHGQHINQENLPSLIINSLKSGHDDHHHHHHEDSNSKPSVEYKKLRTLLKYEEAPKYLQFNSFITSGYRNILPTKLCLESIFWWTNETINIWSHIFGWFLFLGLGFADFTFLSNYGSTQDKIVAAILIVCFQICMILSSIYHTFSCRSERDYDCFLAFDLFGIALSLIAIYISGIYYAFWCQDTLRNFYISTVALIFVACLVLQIPRLKVHPNVKMLMFVFWAAYGVIPTLHWAIVMGGFENAMVRVLIPRVIGMYFLVGLAFFFYITRIPERWFSGKVDYLGHSHNLWHIIIVLALYYWHNTGMLYVEFRMNYGCANNLKNL